MSDAVFPLLPGLAWSVMRTPQWSTNVNESKSGRQYAVSDRIYPTYRWKLPYEFMRSKGSYTELQQLFGFINSLRGRGASFLYRDPEDYVATNQVLGIATGVKQTFQLLRAYGGFIEPVVADNISVVTVNGTYNAPYGTDGNQWVVDVGPPNVANLVFMTGANKGQPIAWSGTYYWRCRLLSDAIPFEEFLSGFWKADIEFESFHP